MASPTIPLSGSGAAAPVSMEAKVDAIFSQPSGVADASAGSTAQPSNPAPSAPPDGTSAEAVPENQQAEQQAQTGEQPTPEGEQTEEPQEYADGEKPLPDMSDTRWGRYKYAYNWGKEVVKALTGNAEFQGALDPALLPTVEELKANQEAAVEHARMEGTFLANTPQRAQEFWGAWLQKSPDAFRNAAQQLPQFLATVDQSGALYSTVAEPVINTFLEGMYRNANAMSDPEIRASMTKAAQVAEWWMTGGPQGGRYRQVDLAGQPTAPDPLAQRESEIERRWNEIQQYERQSQQQAIQGWQSDTNAAIDNSVVAAAEEALAPLKKMYANATGTYEALRDKFISEVQNAVQSNQQQMNLFNLAYDRAIQTRNDAARQSLVNQYRQMAARVIAAHKPTFLKAAGVAAVQQSEARHAQLQQAASRPVPTQGGAPVNRPMSPDLKGMSLDQKIDALLRGMA